MLCLCKMHSTRVWTTNSIFSTITDHPIGSVLPVFFGRLFLMSHVALYNLQSTTVWICTASTASFPATHQLNHAATPLSSTLQMSMNSRSVPRQMPVPLIESSFLYIRIPKNVQGAPLMDWSWSELRDSQCLHTFSTSGRSYCKRKILQTSTLFAVEPGDF